MRISIGNWARAALTGVLLAVNAGAQQLTPTPAGVTMTASGVTLEVTALRDDVVRVRMWKGDAAPEDASWAVLPPARSSRTYVEPALQWTACAVLLGMRFINCGLMCIRTSSTSLRRRSSKSNPGSIPEIRNNTMIPSPICAVRR